MRHKKLKLSLALFGSLLFAGGIIAACGFVAGSGGQAENTPSLMLIAAVLAVAFTIGVAAGFLVKPKRRVPVTKGNRVFARNLPPAPGFAACGHSAKKRDTRIGGMVSPVKAAERHGARIFSRGFSPRIAFQAR